MSPLTLPAKGACFCKEVAYTMNAQPIFTNACHCRNCQALSGSAFAINSIVEASAITVTSATKPIEKPEVRKGEDSRGAKSYNCPTCGIILWATLGMFGDGVVFVRAGTLEENEKVVPDAHFFMRSKHPWIEVPQGVRRFETMPSGGDEPLFGEDAQARMAAVMISNGQQ